jgi:hypothetical protein
MGEINLDNPIFAFYVSVAGMSRQTTAQHLAEFKNQLSYDNITTWIIPVQGESKVECVYPGKSMYNTPIKISAIDADNLYFSVLLPILGLSGRCAGTTRHYYLQ